MSDTSTEQVECTLVVLRVTRTELAGDSIADRLRDELLALYDASGARHVLLDLETVKYLSSAGIRPLLTLNKRVREREGRLILIHLTPEVESVLAATRLISSSRSHPATFERQLDITSAVASLYPSS